MRVGFQISSLVLLVILSGCTAQIERVGADPEKASVANAELGVAYLAQGKLNIAMVKLKKALAFDDSNADAHHYIAELYRRLKQNDLADEHFKSALDLKDEDSAIKNNYGIFLCGTGKYKKGIELFDKVLKDPLYMNKGKLYENMGLCSEKLGNIQHSEKYFLLALKYNYNLPSALLGMAQISFDKSKMKTAKFYLSKHYKVSRKSSQSLWLELLIARKKGNKGIVGSIALKIKQFFPDSREVKLLKKLKLK